MRPAYRSRDAVAVLVFAAVAAVWTFLAFQDDQLSPEQANLAAAAMKSHEPGLFAGDPFMSHGQAWRCHSPGFRAMLKGLLAIQGYSDPLLPFRLLTAPMVMLYLWGMYALLRSHCRSWSISAFVAILSATVTPALAGNSWGVGSLASITPAGLCVCLCPPVVLAFLLWRPYRLRLLVFLLTGALANIHATTAMNLAIALSVSHLIEQRAALRAWPATAGLGLAAILGASPFLVYAWNLADGGLSAVTLSEVRAGLAGIQTPLLFPEMLRDASGWLIRAAVLAVPAAIVLSQVRRFHPRNGPIWIGLACTTPVTALGLQGVSQFIGKAANALPPVIGFSQSSALMMLPLYVLFAEALAAVFRLTRPHRGLLRTACGVLLVAWMIPSDNMRPARHAAYELATAFREEEDRPRRVQRLQEQRQENREIAAIARWATDNTPTSAVFLTDRAEFRPLSRRGIVAGEADGQSLYYLSPSRLPSWLRRLARQSALLYRPGERLSSKDMRDFLADLARHLEVPAGGPRYVIAPAQKALEDYGATVIDPSGAWGRHYRLYRLEAATP